MKSLIVKTAAIATLILASAFSGFSQTRSIEHDFSPFDAIEASNGFKVSTSASDSYSVKLTVDDALESYVECYVKAGTLYIGLDDKNIPKDLKRQYKGRNSADPTLVAVVYLPVLKSLTLNDNSEFINSGNLSGDRFSLALNGTSKISDMKIVAKTVSIALTKNSKFTNANVSAEGDIAMSVDGKGIVTMECAAENLQMTSSGACDVNVSGKVEKKVSATVASSSKTTLTGNAEVLEISGKGVSSKVDASGLKVSDAVLTVSGTEMRIAASDNLELDLGKGSEVTYSGDPKVKIIKIQNASVLRQ